MSEVRYGRVAALRKDMGQDCQNSETRITTRATLTSSVNARAKLGNKHAGLSTCNLLYGSETEDVLRSLYEPQMSA